MARGTTLDNLVVALRHETGRSITTSAGADELARLKHILARTQEFWYEEYAWPHLQAQRTITTVVNQRFYTFPSDMDVEEVQGLFTKDGGNYLPLERGIALQDHRAHDGLRAVSATGTIDVTGGTSNPGTNKITALTVNSVDCLGTAVDWATSNTVTAAAIVTQINSTTSDPDYSATSSGATVTIKADIIQGDTPNTFVIASTVAGDLTMSSGGAMTSGADSEQSDPAQKWDILEDTDFNSVTAIKIEVFPVPASAGTLYLVGKRSLSALTAGSDTADLDDQLIVRTAAAEITARENKRDSEAHSAAAQARFQRLKSRQNAGRAPFTLLGPVSKPTGIEIVISSSV